MERLRCNLCGEIFTAPSPVEAAGETSKNDATALAMMATLRYGHGMPLNRLAALEANLGIPWRPPRSGKNSPNWPRRCSLCMKS